MTVNRLKAVAWVLVADTVLLLTVGVAMWREAPSDAEEAVGKGLFVLGVALVLPAVLVTLAFLGSRSRSREAPAPAPSRSDWDPV